MLISQLEVKKVSLMKFINVNLKITPNGGNCMI